MNHNEFIQAILDKAKMTGEEFDDYLQTRFQEEAEWKYTDEDVDIFVANMKKKMESWQTTSH